MAYRVVCRYFLGLTSPYILAEWHETLAAAVTALLDCQQRGWQSVSLVPVLPDVVPVAPPAQSQLLLFQPCAPTQGVLL